MYLSFAVMTMQINMQALPQKKQMNKAHLIVFFMRLQRKNFLLKCCFEISLLGYKNSIRLWVSQHSWLIYYYRNIIDVGALDSHNLEQHEYLERSRAYAKRIETVGIRVPEISYCLLKDIPAPERILASEPITQNDKDLVSSNIFYIFPYMY